MRQKVLKKAKQNSLKVTSKRSRYQSKNFMDTFESSKGVHGLALVGSDPHELAPGFEVCQNLTKQ